MESEMQRAQRVFESKLWQLERERQNQYEKANKRFDEKLINKGISLDFRNTHFFLFSQEQHDAEMFYYDWISLRHLSKQTIIQKYLGSFLLISDSFIFTF